MSGADTPPAIEALAVAGPAAASGGLVDMMERLRDSSAAKGAM
ncbi:MAG: hypothetical protein AAF941_04200 [Pseudomonadota bacterium]